MVRLKVKGMKNGVYVFEKISKGHNGREGIEAFDVKVKKGVSQEILADKANEIIADANKNVEKDYVKIAL